ncbi:MAG: ferritin-like domain-containing protein [Acidilobaceae archaeon]|nr:ferritin-like domain-containing protein [Acidilobaceae archaeon]MCX8166171.1 ferritin-like domain-containing protein [Acidilobaceae archaeon]MDW7974809.1 ferritin-like domain-containing protein [Sulfolobales archaeon]
MRKEFVKAVDEKRLSQALLAAYADEWLAGYYYMLTAHTIMGHVSGEIAENFMKEAKEELTKHAPMIAERLQSLEVELPRDFRSLWEMSRCKYPELPQDPYDIDGWLIAAIKAEECAIDGYKELYELTHGKDPVTENLAKDLLADEVRHRTELINLLSKEGTKRLLA